MVHGGEKRRLDEVITDLQTENNCLPCFKGIITKSFVVNESLQFLSVFFLIGKVIDILQILAILIAVQCMYLE